MSKELSEFLRTEIEKHGFSERELSRRAGLSIMAVNHIINNPDSNPKIETCIRLADALRLPSMSILHLAGYGEVTLSEEICAEITAFAIYLNNLPQKARTYALEACWSVTRIVQAMDESSAES